MTRKARRRQLIAGRLAVREDEGFFTVRLNVAGLKIEYRDGVLELKLPKR